MTHEKLIALLPNGTCKIADGRLIVNGGHVFLPSLTSLPEGVEFRNGGHVFLNSLTSLPEGVEFKNGGHVSLNSLTSPMQQYQGRTVRIEIVDGYTTIVGERHTVGEAQVAKCRYFKGGPIDDMPTCYVAWVGDDAAHGETAAKAIEDAQFKSATANLDVDELVATIKQRGTVTFSDYRLLTGACREGLERGLEDCGFAKDTPELPLPKVMELSKGRYGDERMRELFA